MAVVIGTLQMRFVTTDADGVEHPVADAGPAIRDLIKLQRRIAALVGGLTGSIVTAVLAAIIQALGA